MNNTAPFIKNCLLLLLLSGLIIACGSTEEEEVREATAIAVTNPNPGVVSDALVAQDGSLAVYEEHIRVLNDCDWVGLMAQYPDDAEIHLSGGAVVKGREAIGELFAGFVLPHAEGGLCGLTFVEESRFEVGGTQNVQWVADAGFLSEPYRGSDAYVSDGRYMTAMVTTFEGTDLMMLQAADTVTNPNTGEVSDSLLPQAGSVAVYEEHIRVLNDCDWVGLMAQYPNDSEIHLSDGTVLKGRQAIGDLFAGFVLPLEDGGLCGLTFVEESRFEAGGSQNVQWVADANFLAEPYRGSDAYVSNGLYMDAMVTTFEGTDLMMLQAADSVTNPNTGEVSDTLVPQAGSVAVYEEHIRVLNDCDWIGLMAQYPNDSEIHLSDGTVLKGRQAIGDLFAGFVLPQEDGGLCGLTFVEESRFEAGGSQNVQWVADADFLAEPYRGSDAYVSNGLYMDAMVTTFEGTDLTFR
ncbi:MAG: hypothetical protein AAF633_01940 [Chloroflexota bacterium]